MRLMNLLNSHPASLRKREQGKRIFILANGPSLNEEDLSSLKNEVVIGMNASTILERQFGFISMYYVLSDARFINAPEKRAWATKDLSPTTQRVIRADLRSLDDPELHDRSTYIAPLSRDGFSRDLASGYFYGCTTTMLAIQLAWHLGSRNVFLLGCDLRYPKDSPRFYNEKTSQLEDSFTSVQISNIVNAAGVFEKDGGRLTNCSPRSFLRPYLPFLTFDQAIVSK